MKIELNACDLPSAWQIWEGSALGDRVRILMYATAPTLPDTLL